MKFFRTQTEEQIVKEYLNTLLSGSKLSVQNICQRCFVSRRTFYNYFDTLEQLEEKSVAYLFRSGGEELRSLSDVSELLYRLDGQRPYLKRILRIPCLRAYAHSQLAAALLTVNAETASRSTDQVLCSALAHALLEWLCGDMEYPIGELVSLCGAFLSTPYSLAPGR